MLTLKVDLRTRWPSVAIGETMGAVESVTLQFDAAQEVLRDADFTVTFARPSHATMTIVARNPARPKDAGDAAMAAVSTALAVAYQNRELAAEVITAAYIMHFVAQPVVWRERMGDAPVFEFNLFEVIEPLTIRQEAP